VFRRLKAVFGGGTTVETTVHTPLAQPGGVLEGAVEIVGGEVEQEIRYLALALVARVEVETQDGEYLQDRTFAEQAVHGAFTLRPGERRNVPFVLVLPLETPFNVLRDRDLPGVRLGLRTELEIARSTDKGDFDPIRVAPLPAQQRVLDALERIGCRLRRADLEKGRVPGAALDFYQEVEYTPPPQFAGRLKELEVTFLTREHDMDVLLEGDRRGGFLDAGGDRVHRLRIGYDALDAEDWEAVLREHLEELGRRRGLFG
jgi:sporulation-control protein